MKKWLLILAFTASTQANEFLSPEDTISLGFINSKHNIKMEREDFEFNESHLMLSLHKPRYNFYIAAFNNSYGDISVTAGWMSNYRKFGPIRPEAYIGVALGYKDHITPNYAEAISPYGWVGITAYTPFEGMTLKLRAVPNVYTLGVYYRL